jgi:AcrR family transcriptional regulator
MGERSGSVAAASSSTPRMGRPRSADRETIVRAALDIGFSRLTMSSVGGRLGVAHSTLYRYFPSRDALAAAAVDHAVDAIEWPVAGADWREFLEATAWAHWRLFAAHPGLAREITALHITGQALVRRDNQTGLVLIGFGFEPADAVLVMDMVAELVTQAFLAVVPPAEGNDSTSVDEAEADAAAQRRRRELVEPWVDMYDARLREVLVEAMSGPTAAWFERKLNLFLDGVGHRLPDA